MSWSKNVTIWCDAKDCCQWINVGQHRVDPMRKAVRANGWLYWFGSDLCPDHAKVVHGNDYERRCGGSR